MQVIYSSAITKENYDNSLKIISKNSGTRTGYEHVCSGSLQTSPRMIELLL